jgi:hypothetical protein
LSIKRDAERSIDHGMAYLDTRRVADELRLIRDGKNRLKACEHNAKQLLSTDAGYADLYFDDFLFRLRFGKRDWTDNDDRAALCELQAAHQVAGFTLGQVRNAVQALANERRRDSLRDYLQKTVPAWDGIARIEHAFCDAWGAADTSLTRAASRNFFMAMAARALRPGVQVDTLWALEGPQGKLKSRSLRVLGGELHAEISAPIGTSDFFRETRGLWLAELSELDALRGREASTIKRLLSAPVDRYVEKYEKHATAYPRRAIFTATTNEAVYWQDSTGARRLVPIKVGHIDLDAIESTREQWFAEARDLLGKGGTWWEYPEAIEVAQEERQQVDPWEDLLRGLIANGRQQHVGVDAGTGRPLLEAIGWPSEFIASAEIMRDWLKLAPHQQGRDSGVRLGKVMRRLGFRPERHGKARERGWIRIDGDGKGGQ